MCAIAIGSAAQCSWEYSPVPLVAACTLQVLPAGANLSTRAASWSSREAAHVSYDL
jgi:hypothetical protein